MPVGGLRKDSTIQIKPVISKSSYIDPTVQATGADFGKVQNNSIYQVQSIQSSDDSSDMADLQSLAASNKLVVKTEDLSTQNNCSYGESTSSCTLSSDIPVYKTGGFDFINWFLNLFGLGHKETPIARIPKAQTTPAVPEVAMANAMEKKIEQANTLVGAKKSVNSSCTDNLPADKRNDPRFVCGFMMAQKAFNKAKAEGKLKQDLFIFNDFSDGGVMGKMWFFNPDGTLASVSDKNPIWVSRGEGGFGEGKGSLKTPNGAIVTRAYRPPRGGNISDGIELEGLEGDNQDILSRGVLLHGWDPYTPTQGCLGIPGTLTTMKRGRDALGGQPPYLDQFKQGFLKDGGVMIYNFTPKRVAECG